MFNELKAKYIKMLEDLLTIARKRTDLLATIDVAMVEFVQDSVHIVVDPARSEVERRKYGVVVPCSERGMHEVQ